MAISSVRPTRLRVEYADQPLGLDEPHPRFSWLLEAAGGQADPQPLAQSAYQVVVGTTGGEGDVWDSGKVESSANGQVEFAGTALQSSTIYYWAVRVWDQAGNASEWSQPATFETGLLAVEDWVAASWISAPSSAFDAIPPSPLLRRDFELSRSDVIRARLYLCGLGYGVGYLDGERIGTRVLDPASTNYAETVLYSTYDISEQLATGGRHVLGVELGRGRYGEPAASVWWWERSPWWDHPKLLALLVVWYADGTVQRIGTDPSWRTIDGPTTYDSLYSGERYDARLARPGWTLPRYDDAEWGNAVQATPPAGELRSQQLEPIAVVQELEPVALTEPTPGTFVYDLGQQLAGWARLTLNGPAGTEVRVRYTERLDNSGFVALEQHFVPDGIQADVYVLRGDGPETYEPEFSYKGFQFVQVTGHPSRPELSDLRAFAIHSDVASVGEFECDDDDVNRLHAGTRWAVLNNLHGIPTDTPVFEKNGWTGDAHLTANVAALNFHMPRFYTKWLDDWVDAQLPSGEFPPIVPTSGWGYHGTPSGIVGPIPAWDAAYFEIPWVMYQHYGDTRILARHYDNQRRYLDFLLADFVTDGVATVGLGDYLPPGAGGIPPEGPTVYETAYTFRIVDLLRQIGSVLGRTDDLTGYGEIASTVRAGFQREFFDAASGTFRGEVELPYRQSPNVVALAFDLVPEGEKQRVLDSLVADLHARDDHLDTGVIGTKFLFPVLTRAGLVDLAFKVAMQRTYPGYGYWLQLGSTALYEMWHAESRSLNHHFYGTVDQWFIEDLAGLAPAAPGWSEVRVRPVPPATLGRARASVDTVRGRVAASWHRVGSGYEVAVELPVGVVGHVHVPQSDGTHAVQVCGPGSSVFRS